MDDVLTLSSVVARRGGRTVLDGVSCGFAAGAVTVLRGPSGSGKSTLLRLCDRLDVPDSGTVSYQGRDVAEVDVLELRRRVGMVFQTPVPLRGTVRDNLAVAAHGTDEEYAGRLARAGLDAEMLERDARELSGGELQRMCLARTLGTDPDVLLLDEPTSSLDKESVRVIEESVRAFVDGGGSAVWVTHDDAQADRLGGVVLMIEGGRVRA